MGGGVSCQGGPRDSGAPCAADQGMSMRRPPRLHASAYTGAGRYFLTIHAFPGTRPVASSATVADVVLQLLHIAAAHGYSVLAYCFMPDHLHILVEAVSADADLRRFAKTFKQVTGFAHHRATGEQLWQEGYYDRVLRREEHTATVVGYIWANPVRKGLVAEIRDWPYSGSEVYRLQDWTGRV